MRYIILKLWKGELDYIKWILYIPLSLLALVYKAILYIREWLYKKGILKTVETGIYVISVGNITLGGTGKTSVVERLAFFLKENGLNPGIITRGYKRKKKGTFSVDIKKDTPFDVGDEAFMLAEKTKVPVLVSDKKYKAIWLGIKNFKIDVAIIDDGFQTRNIKKDMEIVIIQEKTTSNTPNIFPLGPYREPISSLNRADIVLVKKEGLNNKDEPYSSNIQRYFFRYKPAYIYNLKNKMIGHYRILKNKKVLAFSGLGNNESFFNMLEGLGCILVEKISFPDHYKYNAKDIKRLSKKGPVDFMVTTAKDAVKLIGFEVPDNLFYLAVELDIEKEGELMENILTKINAYKMFMAYSH